MGRPTGSGGGAARELNCDELKRIDKCLIGDRHEHRTRLMITIGLFTGLRVGELCSITLGDVYANGKIRKEFALTRNRTKSRKSRTVYLNDQVAKAIEEYIQSEDLADEEPDTPLFASQSAGHRKQLSTRQAIRCIDEAFKEAGVTGASSHSLRRTFANKLRRQGVDMGVLCKLLGHSNLSVTTRYLSIDPIEVEDAVGKLEY